MSNEARKMRTHKNGTESRTLNIEKKDAYMSEFVHLYHN